LLPEDASVQEQKQKYSNYRIISISTPKKLQQGRQQHSKVSFQLALSSYGSPALSSCSISKEKKGRRKYSDSSEQQQPPGTVKAKASTLRQGKLLNSGESTCRLAEGRRIRENDRLCDSKMFKTV